MNKILVIGGAGFIGSAFVRSLTHHKALPEITVVDNLSSGYLDNLKDREGFFEFIRADVRDLTKMPYLQKRFDYIINFAGIAPLVQNQLKPDRSLTVNVGGILEVLELARKYGCNKIIQASTSALYDDLGGGKLREFGLNVFPELVYPWSKKAAEDLCDVYRQSYNIPVVCVRLFNTYGPGNDEKRENPALIPYIMKQLRKGERACLHHDGSQIRDHIYVDDVCSLIDKLMYGETPYMVYNACTGRGVSVNYIYECVAKAMKSDLKPVYLNSDQFWANYRTLTEGEFPLKPDVIEREVKRTIIGDNTRSVNTGWKPAYTFEEGIAKTCVV